MKLILLLHVFRLCLCIAESVQVPVFTTGPEKDGFDLGFRKNFICLFGSDRRFWFLPTATRWNDRHCFYDTGSQYFFAWNGCLCGMMLVIQLQYIAIQRI